MKEKIDCFFDAISIKYTFILTSLSWGLVCIDAINKSISSIKSENIKICLNFVLDIYNIFSNIFKFNCINILIVISIILTIILVIKIKRDIFDNKHKCKDITTAKVNNKKEYQIIGHLTMGNTQFIVSEKDEEYIEPCINELNLVSDMKDIRSYKDINYVVNKQDSFIKEFENKLINGEKCGYMGLAHTPLILRAGYKIGDGSKIKIFHKKRDFEYYEALNDEENNMLIGIDRKEINKRSDELILGISTTFEINDNDLKILKPQNKNLIIFKTEDLGYDVITSQKQIECYVAYIMKIVRDFVKSNNINKIHMVISSSVALTFCLGQAISETYDPEIIIYHYESKNPKKYPWGMLLFNDSKECIVEN